MQIWDTKRNNSFEKWVLVDEYNLMEDFDDNVTGLQIISTHFEQTQVIIKVLFIFEHKYTIVDILISIKDFKEFMVKIIPVSEKKFGFTINKMLVSSNTEQGRYHVLASVKNRKQKLCLFKVELDAKEKNDKLSTLWSSETIVTPNIRCVLGPKSLGIINDDDHCLYIYDLIMERYSGFINIKNVVSDFEGQNKDDKGSYVSDMLFSRNHARGSLIVYYKDKVLLFSQTTAESLDSIQNESWTLIHKFNNVLGLSQIRNVAMQESYYGKLLFIIDHEYFLFKRRFHTNTEGNTDQDEHENKLELYKNHITFEGLFTLFQEAKPIYHPQLLKQIYLKGHMNLVLKILVKLYELLQLDSKNYKIPSFCDFSLEMIINELNLNAASQPQKEVPKKAANTAASLFNMFAWDDDDKKETTSLFGTEKKEEKKKDPNAKITVEEEFEEIKDDLVHVLEKPKTSEKINMKESTKHELLMFIKIFSKLYTKQYYSDKLTDALLRKFTYDKDYNIKKVVDEIESQPEKYNPAQMAVEKMKAESSSSNLEAWTTMQVAFAFHSKDQDVIYQQIINDDVDWNLCNRLSIPIWMKETEKLKKVVELVAKTTYRNAGTEFGNQSLAGTTAIWYMILGKKEVLRDLYQYEPNNRKVYELLNNDFSLPRWQKAADKNAMVLISRKNYYLGIAFFILAGKIKDAITTTLNKLKDLNLAILIARLVKGYEDEETFGLIDRYLIEGGKNMDDPWMVSIGYWWKKQHFDAINTLSSMIGETKDSLSQQVFSTKPVFDLFKINPRLHEGPVEKEEEEIDSKLVVKVKLGEGSKQEFEYPVVSGRNAFVLDFVQQLLDHHIIKRELKKNQFDDDSEEEGGDLFDNFFGGGGPEKKKEEKKTDTKTTISVDQEMLMSITSDYYADTGYCVIGLILAYENKDIVMKKTASDNLAKNLIIEVVKGTKADNNDSSERVTKAIDELVKRFKLKKEDYYVFVRNQYRFLENLRLEFRFIKTDKDTSTLLFRLEEELLKALDFINVMTAYPFAIDLEKDESSLLSICSLIEYLEDVVECMFIYENEVVEESKNLEVSLDEAEENVTDVEPVPVMSSGIPVSVATLNDGPNVKYSLKKRSSKIHVNSTRSMKKPGKRLQNENSEYMAKLCCKLRTSFLLYMSMILLSFLIKKFEFIRPLLHDLRALMTSTNNLATGDNTDSPSKIGNKMQSLANIQINLKNLKEVTNALLTKATKKDKKDSFDSESSEEDAFMQNFVSKPDETDELKEKREKEEERKKQEELMYNKIEEFTILWMRQIVIYNTHYVLHLALANSNLTSILDVRPSIVKASSIKYSLMSLMKPRLQSIQQVNNFKSMKRILDNIVSYFFQNFLSVKERALVTEDLSRIRNGGRKMST